jgi:thioredoxin 1
MGTGHDDSAESRRTDERGLAVLKRRLSIVAAAVLVFAAAFILRGTRQSDSGEENHHEQQEATGQTANQPLPRLVDLGADKCVPCKKMAPVLKELATEYQGTLVVEFIDVWKNPDAAKQYGIRMIPTQIFFDASGEERFRNEGFMAKGAILEKWTELGVELRSQPPGTGS